jgi:hypothetical protein
LREIKQAPQWPIRNQGFGAYPDKEETAHLSSPESQGVAPDLATVMALKFGDQTAMAELDDRYSSITPTSPVLMVGTGE